MTTKKAISKRNPPFVKGYFSFCGVFMKNNFLRLVAIASVVLVTLFAFSCKSSEATEEPVASEEPVAAQASEVQVSEPGFHAVDLHILLILLKR